MRNSAVVLLALLPVFALAATWTSQGSGTSYGLYGVAFVDASNGWAVGFHGTILHTPDGGTTWGTQPSGTTNDLLKVAFVDGSNGWAVGTSGMIRHTSDGGTSWGQQPSGTTNNLTRVAFADASNGWAVGSYGTIRHTSDGGNTWGQQISNTNNTLYGVVFVDASNGWAVGENGTIRHTSDGGNSWGPQTSNSGVYLKGVDFVDAFNGWVVGYSGTILRTSNGGDSWTADASGTTNNLHDVAFVDANHGWAVGDGGTIRHTTDGGHNWLADTSGTTNNLNGVAFVDVNHGWAVGASGKILYYVPLRPPTAFIDSIAPNPSLVDSMVWFAGHGVDSNGTVIAYNWRSSISGQISTQASFSTNSLPLGNHIIYFKVRDNDNQWSPEVNRTLTITDINLPPYVPYNPWPGNGAPSVPVTTYLYLSWLGGDPNSLDTVRYDVYFGTSNPPPRVATGQLATTYNVGMLEFSTLYFWKIMAHDNRGDSTAGPLWQFTTVSNSPPYTPSDPCPADTATNVSVSAHLSWTGGDPNPTDTVFYDVYFGTTNPPPRVISSQLATTYDPGILVNSTLYFWKITAHDSRGHMTAGPLWQFTTAAENTSGWTFTTNTTISASDMTYEGYDITVDGCVLTVNGDHSFHSLLVTNSGTVKGDVLLTIATNATIQSGSCIDVSDGGSDGRGTGGACVDYWNGYPIQNNWGGSGHGGAGQTVGECGAQGGSTYGSTEAPVEFGTTDLDGGAYGGGRIRVVVGDTLRIEGCLKANADYHWGGQPFPVSGGSGGSVYLTVGALSGSGTISACGACETSGLDNWGVECVYGGGGGGRVGIYYGTSSFPQANVSVSGGWTGGTGTVYWSAFSSVNLISPNGCEVWMVDNVDTIKWRSYNLSENVKIELNRSYPGSTWEIIAANTANSGSYAWTVTGPATSAARVRITGVTHTTVGDTSYSNFTVSLSSILPPDDVVISRNQNDIHLNWNPVGSGLLYKVYSDSLSTGQLNTLVGTVADTFFVDSNAVTVPPSTKFYIVRSYRP